MSSPRALNLKHLEPLMLKAFVFALFLSLTGACGGCAGAVQKQPWPEPASMPATAPASAPVEEKKVEAVPEPASQPVPETGLRYFKPAKGAPMIELKSFDKQSVEGFSAKFKELDDKNDEVWVRIDSGGGSVFGGQDVIHVLEAATARVVCVVDWKAYSMAFYTLQSSGCDFRLMTKRASLMAHEPSTESAGKSGDLRDDADLLDALNEGFLVTAAERMRVPVETLRAKTERRNFWMDYKIAEKWRAIDGWTAPELLPAPTPFEVKKSLLQMLLGG